MVRLSEMMRVIFGVLLLIFAPVNVFAAQNPVSFTLTPSDGLPPVTKVGNSYVLRYTLKNNLPFNEPIKSITYAVNAAGFSMNDECSGKVLAAKTGTCNVDLTFIPVTTGTASVQVTMTYDKNVVPLSIATTNVQTDATGGGITGTVSKQLPPDTTVGTGYTVEFTYKNNSSSTITASNIAFSGSVANLTNVTNGCTSALQHGHTCTITGTYTPSTTGHQSIGTVYYYNSNNSQYALSTSTLASNGSGGCASVTAITNLLLPTTTYQYADNVIKVTFKNECDAASATLGQVNWSANLGSSSLAKTKGTHLGTTTPVNNWVITQTSSDNCSNKTLAANSSCTVIAAVRPQGTGSNLVVDATVSYSESGQTKHATASSTATTVKPNDGNNRIVTIVNQCSVPVWMTYAAAATSGSPSCSSSACPTGSTCGSNNICYYSNPPLDGNHTYGEMKAAVSNEAPDTMDIHISEDYSGTNPAGNVLYNGGIAARLGCTATGNPNNPLFCTVNNCGGTANPASKSTDVNGMCAPGTGPSTSPAITFNAVEFTFNRNLVTPGTPDGVYDEQTINGINVPIEMVGRGSASTGSAPYNNCPPSGGPVQVTTGNAATQLGACTYNYTTPSSGPYRASNYIFVSGDGTSCDTSDSQCNSDPGTTCGLAKNTTTGNIDKECGQVQGYVSVNINICSQTATFSGSAATLQSTYNCSTNYPTSGTTLFTGAQLYACSGTYAGQSCYNPAQGYPITSCCGCIDWWTVPGVTVPTDTVSCTQKGTTYSNPNWTTIGGGIVQPQIQWMKQACPTAYSYQYDDKSSSFFCTVPDSTNTKIVTNYQVTFCPGGNEVSKITT